MIAVKNVLSSDILKIASELEIIWVRVKLVCSYIIIGVCYRPPSFSGQFCDKLNECINCVVSSYPRCPVVLAGDFNYPGINWSDCSLRAGCRDSSECRDFLAVTQSYNLTQIVLDPTRGDSVLDLLFSSHPECMSACHILETISDHNAVLINSTFSPAKRNIIRKTFLNFSKVDANKLQFSFDSFSSEYLQFFDTRSVSENWALLKDKITEIVKECVPVVFINKNLKSPWFNNYHKKTFKQEETVIFFSQVKRHS